MNFDLPNEPEAYVHRIGRTARAGAEGRAVSFCSEDELEFLREIEKVIKMPIPRWDAHDWHIESLADRHARGKSFAKRRRETVRQRRTGPLERSQALSSMEWLPPGSHESQRVFSNTRSG